MSSSADTGTTDATAAGDVPAITVAPVLSLVVPLPSTAVLPVVSGHRRSVSAAAIPTLTNYKMKFSRKSGPPQNNHEHNFSTANDIVGIVMLETHGATDLPKLNSEWCMLSFFCGSTRVCRLGWVTFPRDGDPSPRWQWRGRAGTWTPLAVCSCGKKVFRARVI